MAAGEPGAEPLEIDVQRLAAMRRAGAQLTLLDVREPWEIEICAFEPSLNIPLGEVAGRLAEIPVDDVVIVVCHHGIRSRQVTLWLRDQGCARAANLRGGVDAWARQIDPAMGVY